MFNYQEFGLKKNNLYEIIATTYSITENGMQIKPNASCMGIRLIEDTLIQISPFYSTTTYKNLKEQSIITINLVNDVYLYALAALKEPDSVINLIDFPIKYYDFKTIKARNMDIPYIRKAWGILIGEVIQEFQKNKTDDLGEYIMPVFKLKVFYSEKLKQSYKLFNRAENLALETIILATRLKIAKENENQSLFSKNYEKIRDYKENIKRFGKNEKALKTIELVSIYIDRLME